jgi:hypothetical protein
VKHQGRGEADNAARNKLRGFSQCVVGIDRCIRQLIQPARQANDQAAALYPRDRRGGDAGLRELDEAHHPCGFHQGQGIGLLSGF